MSKPVKSEARVEREFPNIYSASPLRRAILHNPKPAPVTLAAYGLPCPRRGPVIVSRFLYLDSGLSLVVRFSRVLGLHVFRAPPESRSVRPRRRVENGRCGSSEMRRRGRAERLGRTAGPPRRIYAAASPRHTSPVFSIVIITRSR